jgi:hypothetical protein
MHKTKLLLSGLPNSGKTTLLQTLDNVLVFARDGKKYPFPQPHVNVENFDSITEILELFEQKINAYKEAYGKYPENIVIDSISKFLLDIESNIVARIKSFPYGVVNTEIKMLMDFIETNLAPNFNIILISHAMHDADTETYNLVNAGGSWGKKGGVLSEVDQAIFLEVRGKKRVVHLRNSQMAARTTMAQLPDKVDAKDFSLRDHIKTLTESQDTASSFAL